MAIMHVDPDCRVLARVIGLTETVQNGADVTAHKALLPGIKDCVLSSVQCNKYCPVASRLLSQLRFFSAFCCIRPNTKYIAPWLKATRQSWSKLAGPSVLSPLLSLPYDATAA
jgi:hypothetical protein